MPDRVRRSLLRGPRDSGGARSATLVLTRSCDAFGVSCVGKARLTEFEAVSPKLTSLIAILLALLSGVLAWQQRQGRLVLHQQVTFLAGEVRNKSEAMQEQAALLERLQQENNVYATEVAALRQKVSTRTPASTGQDRESNSSSASSQGAAAKMFSKMAKDPKLKEVTRQWELARIKKVYGDFVRGRHLDPQQTKQFFDLLVQEDTLTREETAKLLSGEEKETTADEPSSAPRKAELEQQLKLLLGDNIYAAYQDYKKSTGDRSTLLQIQEHFATTSVPLRNDQANTLLQVILEEHDLNQRVLDRIESVLTPEQYEELQRFQNENRELQTLRIDAALEMMERKSKNDTPAPTRSP